MNTKRKNIITSLLLLLSPMLLFSCKSIDYRNTGDKKYQITGKDKQVIIKRDSYGVPHIYASNTFNLFYGYGYAVAEDRLFSMEMAKRTGQGRVAEALGAGHKDKYIKFDRKIRSHYNPQSIKQQLSDLSQEDRDVFDGYAAGINAYLQKINSAPNNLMPKQFLDFGFQPKQWTGYDVAMVFVGSMVNRFGDFNTELANANILSSLQKKHGHNVGKNIFNQLNPRVVKGAPTTIGLDDWEAFQSNLPPQNQQLFTLNTNTFEWEQNLANHKSDFNRHQAFSNLILLGTKKAKDADAILFNGPQFGRFIPAYTYSVGLHGAGFNLVGNTPYAYPVILFGHNEKIAWGSTWGAGDLIDVYVESLNPDNNDEYLFNGSYRSIEKRREIIKVKNGKSVEFWAYRTVHGPVVKLDKEKGKAYTKKRTWDGRELDSLLGWMHSTKAGNFEDWLSETKNSALNINMYYADKNGNIGYVFTGKYPIRKEGHDNRLPVSGLGDAEWIGLHDFSYNPKVYNPQQGYIVNWNNRPAYGVLNPDMFWYSWSKADRVSFLIDEINKKQRITADEVWSLLEKSSLADLNAKYFIPLITKAVAQSKDTVLQNMASLLQSWDLYSTDKDTDGKYDETATAIFQTFLSQMIKETLQDDLGDIFKFYAPSGYQQKASNASGVNIGVGVKAIVEAILAPDQQPYDFFNGQPPEVVTLSAFVKTKVALEKSFGMDMNQWKLPVAKLKYSPNNFLHIPQANANEEIISPLFLNRGTENNLVVFSSGQVVSYEVAPPGQSGFVNPDGKKNKYYYDQVQMYQRFQKKRMWLSDQDVETNKESQITLTIDRTIKII